jgi:hypothetical protein
MWAKNYERCIKCGTVDIRHLARGLCTRCYYRATDDRHKGNPAGRRPRSGILTKQYLEEEYLKKKRSTSDIAKTTGFDRHTILNWLSTYAIPRRSLSNARAVALDKRKITQTHTKFGKEESIILHKRVVNEDFFSKWNEEMAWVLGIVYTDGNLNPGRQENPLRKTNSTTASVSISQKEPELLIKVTNLMGSNALLLHRPDGVNIISISNNKIYKDLTNIGLTPNKSLTVTFPDVPPEHVRHFIRGCWDGDGSIGLYNNQYLARFYSGSTVFMEQFVNHLTMAGLPQRNIYHKYTENNKPYYWINFKGKIVAELYRYLYEDVNQSCYLERKYRLFKDSYNKYKNKV